MKEINMDIKRESLLNALDNPLTSDEEWEELLADEDNVRDIQLLKDCRNFFLEKETVLEFDAEKAWIKFSSKHKTPKKSRRSLVVICGGIVACLLFALGLLLITQHSDWEQGVVVFSPNVDSQEVILTSSNGLQTILSSPLMNSLSRKNNEALDKGRILKYNKMSHDEMEKPEIHTLTTPMGAFYQVELSDGTQVWLNAESRLVYPNFFTSKERVVELSGEGFFKVAYDAERPFKVKANNIVTEVLGTEFNMRIYSQADLHVTLIRGSVKVKEEQSQSEVVIRPGEDAFLKLDGSFGVQEVDIDGYYLWTEGFFYFDKESLVEIMRDLGRWYNVKVIFRNKAVMENRLHFFAQRDKPLNNAIKLLNKMGVAKFSVKDNIIFVD